MDQAPGSLLRALDEIDSVALFHVDLEGTIVHANEGLTRILGYQPKELIGQPVESLLPAKARSYHAVRLRKYAGSRLNGHREPSPIVRRTRYFPQMIRAHEGQALEFAAINCHGRPVPISLTVNEIFDEDGRLSGFVGFIIDCSAEHAFQEQVRQQGLVDDLTGLLCWKGMMATVSEVVKHSDPKEDYFYSVMHIDIDHFAALAFESSSMAEAAVSTFARWLKAQVEILSGIKNSIVSRHFNATEFLVYLPRFECRDAAAIATQLSERFRQINLGRRENPFRTTLSIGLVTGGTDETFETVVSKAAHACHIAKRKGHDKIVHARPQEMKIYELGQKLREALRDDGFAILGQKIVSLQGKSARKWHSVEILCRLPDDNEGWLPSSEIFEAAEQLGLALEVDLHVIDKTLSMLSESPEMLDVINHLAINLSGISISNENLFNRLRELIKASRVAPQKLCFEITESAAIHDNQVALETLKQLRAMGCRIAIDDFGSGYSNYQTLSRFPIDIVKIDGSYVRKLIADPTLRIDVKGMIASARSRGIELVGEYAETPEIVEELWALGVDHAQGYAFHRPEPLDCLLDVYERQAGCGQSPD